LKFFNAPGRAPFTATVGVLNPPAVTDLRGREQFGQSGSMLFRESLPPPLCTGADSASVKSVQMLLAHYLKLAWRARPMWYDFHFA